MLSKQYALGATACFFSSSGVVEFHNCLIFVTLLLMAPYMNRTFRLLLGIVLLLMSSLSLSATDHPSLAEINQWDKQTLRSEGYRYLMLGDSQGAIACGKRLLQLANIEKDSYFAELYGYLFLGMATVDSDKGYDCFTHLHKALLLAEQSHNHDALAAVYNTLGNYSLFVNDDSYTAISWYFKALEEAKLIGDNRRYAAYLSNIAGAYTIREDLSGLSFAEEAIEWARKSNEQATLYYALLTATSYYLLKSDTTMVKRALDEAEQLYDQLKLKEEVDLWFFRARYHELLGQNQTALASFERAMALFDEAHSSSITIVYLYYARLLRRMKRLDQAIEMLELGLNRIEAQGAVIIHKSQLFRELLLCYQEQGAYSKALEYAIRYQEYQRQKVNDTHERALQETRIKHDIYSREQRISQQQMELLQNRYKITTLLLVLLVMVVALGLTFFFYRKKDQLLSRIVTQNQSYQQREQMLLQQLEQVRSHVENQSSGTQISEERVQELMGRFTTLMMEQQLYADASITVATVAERLGTNRTYLSKAINESTGKSFPQVVSEYRIRQAIAEISDLKANKPLKQIAGEVGFNSISTFYATFQTVVGMSPARYRAKLKEVSQ